MTTTTTDTNDTADTADTAAPSAVRGPSAQPDPSAAPDPRGHRRGRPLARRILATIGSSALLLWAVATIVFFLQHLVPGDPAQTILGGASANPPEETLQAVREQYGFDQPVLVQYGHFLAGLATGDLGESYTMKQSVVSIVAEQIVPTLQLTGAALLIAWAIAIALTLATAGRPGRWARIGSAIEVVFAALPHFWLGVVLLVVFAVMLQWLPVVDDGPAGLVLPALTLGVPLGGFLAQVTRDEFDVALRQPFVLSALSRGARPGDVRWRQVLRHAALPGIALSGWGLGSLISGAVVVEVIFSRQGIGQVLVAAVTAQDLPLVIGVTFVVAAVYVLANILSDLASVLVDPRLRHAIGRAS